MIINLRVVQCVGKKLSRPEEGGSTGCGKGDLRDNNVSSKLLSLSFSFFLNNINNAMWVRNSFLVCEYHCQCCSQMKV